jgi:hypothetical protein
MPSLWFVVPVHGRLPLASICLRQLRRTCDALTEAGIEATAVIVADKENLRDLQRRLKGSGETPMLGFGTVKRDNTFLSRRFNDGIQLALDPQHNPRPADYVVPCGSDDWVDWRILTKLPEGNTVLGFQHLSFVREDGREMTSRFLNYPGGCGIRVYPRRMMARLGYRPADEDRKRACDTSILRNVIQAHQGIRMQILHGEIDPRQIVDWKSSEQQLNSYEALEIHKPVSTADPFSELADIYPAESLRDMEAHYTNARPQRFLVTT